MREIVFKEDFPIMGEAYKVGEVDGKYFFAWGSTYPYADEVPTENVSDGENGIEWYDLEYDALMALLDAVEAVVANGDGKELYEELKQELIK